MIAEYEPLVDPERPTYRCEKLSTIVQRAQRIIAAQRKNGRHRDRPAAEMPQFELVTKWTKETAPAGWQIVAYWVSPSDLVTRRSVRLLWGNELARRACQQDALESRFQRADMVTRWIGMARVALGAKASELDRSVMPQDVT